MTKVAKLFQEEKEAAIKETAKETAIEMLKDGYSIDKIVKYVKNLSVHDVEQIKKELQKNDNYR